MPPAHHVMLRRSRIMKDYGNAQKGKRLIAAMAWSRDRKSVMLGKMLRAAASAMSCRAGAVALLVPVRLSVAMVKWRATRSVMMVQNLWGGCSNDCQYRTHASYSALLPDFCGYFWVKCLSTDDLLVFCSSIAKGCLRFSCATSCLCHEDAAVSCRRCLGTCACPQLQCPPPLQTYRKAYFTWLQIC